MAWTPYSTAFHDQSDARKASGSTFPGVRPGTVLRQIPRCRFPFVRASNVRRPMLQDLQILRTAGDFLEHPPSPDFRRDGPSANTRVTIEMKQPKDWLLVPKVVEPLDPNERAAGDDRVAALRQRVDVHQQVVGVVMRFPPCRAESLRRQAIAMHPFCPPPAFVKIDRLVECVRVSGGPIPRTHVRSAPGSPESCGSIRQPWFSLTSSEWRPSGQISEA